MLKQRYQVLAAVRAARAAFDATIPRQLASAVLSSGNRLMTPRDAKRPARKRAAVKAAPAGKTPARRGARSLFASLRPGPANFAPLTPLSFLLAVADRALEAIRNAITSLELSPFSYRKATSDPGGEKRRVSMPRFRLDLRRNVHL